MLCCLLLTFSKFNFYKNSSRYTIRVSKSLKLDQDQHFVGPDHGPNSLHMFQQRTEVTTSKKSWLVDWFDSLSLSQQLWSCPDGQFTKPHFFLCKLDKAVNEYFVHILSLVTDKNPS